MMDLLSSLVEEIEHALVITIFVFSMMIIVDYINVFTRGRIENLVRKGWHQYTLSSFLGVTPGCLGAFMSVSMYIHGALTFGALTACMIATSGDEAFVMLTLFPRDAILLFTLLFIIGVITGSIVDRFVSKLGIRTCSECILQEYHEEESRKILSARLSFSKTKILILIVTILFSILNVLGILGPKEFNIERILFLSLLGFIIAMIVFSSEHYIKEHIVKHILKNHIWKVFLWTAGALIFVNIILSMFNLERFVETHIDIILLLSAIIGIIPESGPHMIFVIMYSKGLIPFSVLLTSSIVQDGHGMLPLFSYTIRDSLLMKFINLTVGLVVGGMFYMIGF